MHFEVYEADMPHFVQKEIAPLLDTYRIITLQGPLGAGKTSLVRLLLAQRGITGAITSPTFGYVNTYTDPQGQHYHHFDLYRLSTADSFYAAGFEEYLYDTQAFCFIEWPEVIAHELALPALRPHVCAITLLYDMNDFSRRTIKILTPEDSLLKK